MITSLINTQKFVQGCKKSIELSEISKKYFEREAAIHPCVGAVLTDKNGRILSEGIRRKDGKSHAEVFAIKKLKNGDKNRVHTAISTLEPCSSRSNHDEICCAKRLVRLGVEQVIIGTLDPAAGVRGRGAQILQIRGIYFTMFPKDDMKRALESNKDYIDFLSDLYSSGSSKKVKSGIVQDISEFDLNYGPNSLLKYLRSKKFIKLAEKIFQDYCSKYEVTDSVGFEPYFSIAAVSGKIHEHLYTTKNQKGQRLYELLASYLAISPAAEKASNYTVTYGYLASWFRSNRRKLLKTLH